MREITYNPNYSLTPQYVGEMVAQLGSQPCQNRIWQAVDISAARWVIISGQPCFAADGSVDTTLEYVCNGYGDCFPGWLDSNWDSSPEYPVLFKLSGNGLIDQGFADKEEFGSSTNIENEGSCLAMSNTLFGSGAVFGTPVLIDNVWHDNAGLYLGNGYIGCILAAYCDSIEDLVVTIIAQGQDANTSSPSGLPMNITFGSDSYFALNMIYGGPNDEIYALVSEDADSNEAYKYNYTPPVEKERFKLYTAIFHSDASTWELRIDGIAITWDDSGEDEGYAGIDPLEGLNVYLAGVGLMVLDFRAHNMDVGQYSIDELEQQLMEEYKVGDYFEYETFDDPPYSSDLILYINPLLNEFDHDDQISTITDKSPNALVLEDQLEYYFYYDQSSFYGRGGLRSDYDVAACRLDSSDTSDVPENLFGVESSITVFFVVQNPLYISGSNSLFVAEVDESSDNDFIDIFQNIGAQAFNEKIYFEPDCFEYYPNGSLQAYQYYCGHGDRYYMDESNSPSVQHIQIRSQVLSHDPEVVKLIIDGVDFTSEYGTIEPDGSEPSSWFDSSHWGYTRLQSLFAMEVDATFGRIGRIGALLMYNRELSELEILEVEDFLVDIFHCNNYS